MALLLTQTLYNQDVVRYHHFTHFRLSDGIASGTLSSFRSREHRALPVDAVLRRTFDFVWDGDMETLRAQGYAYVKTLPEWAGAEDC